MPVVFGTLGQVDSGKSSGTSLTLTTTAAIAKGATVAIRHASDNLSNSTTVPTPNPGTVTCSVGGAVTNLVLQVRRGSGSASGAGVVILVWTFTAGVAIPSGSTITATVGTAVTARAIVATQWAGAEPSTTTPAPVTNGGTSGSQTVSITPANITQSVWLVFAGEDNQGHSFTPAAASPWITGTVEGTTGGNAATNVVQVGISQIPVAATTARTHTFTSTMGGGDWVAAGIVFNDVSPTVSSISPTSAANNVPMVLTITGTNYIDVTAVTLAGTNATSYTVNSATSITATFPADMSLGVKSLVVFARGAYSSGNNFTVTQAPPNAPTGLTTISASTGVSVSWVGPNSGSIPTSYEIFRDGVSLDSVNFPTSNYVDRSGTAGVTYAYTVKAVNSSGSSAASNSANGTKTVLTTSANDLWLGTHPWKLSDPWLGPHSATEASSFPWKGSGSRPWLGVGTDIFLGA